MAYVYKFIDVQGNNIYVGYTGQTLDKRIGQHFDKGHLPNECYKSIAKIECKKYKTKSEAQIMEVFYINKYKPKFNKLNKQNDELTLNIEDNQRWKLYREYKKDNDKNNSRGMIFVYAYIIIMFSYMISFLLK